MKSRLVFWKSCLALAVTAMLATSTVFAQSVRWKDPEAKPLALPSNSITIQQPVIDSVTVSTVTVHSPAKMVRYNPQDTPSIAEVDTNFPESRPTFSREQDIATPLAPTQGSLLGSTPSFGGDYRSAQTEEERRKKLEIICPDTGILKPIRDIDHDIRLTTVTSIPKECPMIDSEYFPSRNWNRICFMWKASALCHKPLYFEDKALEVYGHTYVQEEFQPIVSSLRFFLTVPVLPYKMGINPPNECVYALGDYRPGDCAPYMLDPLPLSVRAGLIQAGAIVGGVAILP